MTRKRLLTSRTAMKSLFFTAPVAGELDIPIPVQSCQCTHSNFHKPYVAYPTDAIENPLIVCPFGRLKMLGQLPSYLRRANHNGTFDSICIRCFETVASAKN